MGILTPSGSVSSLAVRCTVVSGASKRSPSSIVYRRRDQVVIRLHRPELVLVGEQQEEQVAR